MTAADLPLHAWPHRTDAGSPWVEAVVTGTAALTLARSVAQRLAGQGITGRPTQAIVTLIAGAITDTGISMGVQECDDLAHVLADAATQAQSPELAEAAGA